ncbi:MAG: hypothetical protein J5517_08805 [Eubacterium sp.]|nr:hypothetical protein [Eubacterium sp.]
MYSKVQTANKIVRMIYQFLFIILLLNISLVLIYFPMLTALEMASIAVMLIVSYFFRDKFSRAFSLLTVHMVIAGIYYFALPNLAPKIMILITSAVIMMDGVYYMRRSYTLKRLFDVPWGAVVLGIIALISAHYMNVPSLQWQGLIMTTAMVFLFIVTLYLEGLEAYIMSSRTLTGFPIKQIVSVNTIIVCGIMLIAIVVIVLADVLGFYNVIMQFLKVLLYLLKLVIVLIILLMRFFFSYTGYQSTDENTAQELPEYEENTSILLAIIEFVVVAAVLVFAAFLVFLMIKYLVRLFLSRRSNLFDLTENISGFNEKSMTKERIKREKLGSRLDPVMRARRIYKKKVESFSRFFSPKRYNTAGDIEDRIVIAVEEKNKAKEAMMGKAAKQPVVSDDGETLRTLYENVRYGNLVPDRHYLRRMKKM